MIGRGGVFAALRSMMLQSIPLGAKCHYNSNATLGEWLEKGTFVVLGATKRSITLQTNPTDYAIIRLNEVEHLLNHALEHIQELTWYLRAAPERSETWAAVTAYYLGFFSASVILRLVGIPNVFLPRDRLASLRLMCTAPHFPPAGSFQFTTGNTLSVTSVELKLSIAEKSHEATWKSLLGLLKALKDDKAIVFAADEADFYDSLCSNSFCSKGVGFDWPSDVRNKANYRPGHSYRLARPLFNVSGFFAPWRFATAEEVFLVLNAAYRRCNADRQSFARQVEMMINVSVVVHLIARSLYRELEERRMTDRRWEILRSAYKKSRGLGEHDFDTLCA
jgi:hypothetical protein